MILLFLLANKMYEFFESILHFLQFLIKLHPMSIDSLTLIGLLSCDAMIPQHFLLIIKHKHHFLKDVMVENQLISIIHIAFLAKIMTKVFGICINILELDDRNAILLMQLIDEMSIMRRAFILHHLLAHIMRVIALI